MTKMTCDQVIEITVNILNNIEVPVRLFDKIGTPIKSAIWNLEKCIGVMRSNATNESNTESPDEQRNMKLDDEPEVAEEPEEEPMEEEPVEEEPKEE